MTEFSHVDISVSDHAGDAARGSGEWALVPSDGDRVIHEGTLSGACASLLADEAVLPQHGVRWYWLRRQDHAGALVLKLASAFHIFTVVGSREQLFDLQREVRRALISQGGIAA
jgi:hypothetical protein